jgi:phosphoribosylanthranilate isomerase
MTVQVKICGLSTPETVDAAIKGGATHIGFNFIAKSPRYIDPDKAGALARRLPAHVSAVGLFLDPEADYVDSVRAQVTLKALQFHGDERPAFTTQMGRRHGIEIWKAIPLKTRSDLALAEKYRDAAHRILYDAKAPKGAPLPGGTGLRIDWTLLDRFSHPLPWVLAGGLDAQNLAEAVRLASAEFVDVSSGIESAPGIKDVDKIKAFLKAAANL